MAYTILRGGLVLDIRAGSAAPADIVIENDTIRELGPPGCPAPEGAREISAARRLIHPGLVNAHTHSHGNLAKGMGDRWTLELLLTAAPRTSSSRPSSVPPRCCSRAAPPAMICSSNGQCPAATGWRWWPPPMPK